MIKYPPFGENLVIIGPVDPEIICLKWSLKVIDKGVHSNDRSKLRSYWTEVHQIFKICSQILTLLMCLSPLRYSNPFWSAKATNEGE